jgi:hypothetical protein
VVSATLTDAQPGAAAAPVSATVTPIADGTYQIQYTLEAASPRYELRVQVQAGGVGPVMEIAGSPFQVECQVSETAPVNTRISGIGATLAVAGQLTAFTVTLYDAGDNQRTGGGDQLLVAIDPVDAGPAAVADIEVFDAADGTYTVRYVVLDSSSLYTISVTVNADGGNTKTSSLTVVANRTSPASSMIDWTSWASPDPLKIVDLGTSYGFTTLLKDAYGNPIKEEPWTLVTEIEGEGQSHFFTASLADLSAGEYETTFTLPASGDRTRSLCGTYTLD